MAEEANSQTVISNSTPDITTNINSDIQSLITRESAIKGVSIRAILAILVTLTLCSMTLLQFKIVEPFYSIAVFVLGFFFGQKNK